ncbi:PD-(D/E)XK nuclease family protein [Geodermatophilus sp. URMC 60]
MSTPAIAAWEHRLANLWADWATLDDRRAQADRATVANWTARLDSMAGEMASLREQGDWLGGPRTLLEAAGLERNELILTAGLAWVLDPEGFHQLGDRVLVGFLDRLGVERASTHPVRLVREEQRNDTRADLLVRVPGVTILVESKVGAGEQHDQCIRLAAEWADENPVLVFLTRDGRPPTTAGEGLSDWWCLRWADIAAVVESAISVLPAGRDAAPGVHDYLTTLHHHHGEKLA